jgi:transcriptional regulator with PAS, ATPase and Fis domain
MVEAGEFRADLLYRLNVVKLLLPPLRQRRADIPLLAHHFLDKYMNELSRNVHGFLNSAMRAMLAYDWPGNVRELQNVIERAVIFAEDRHIGHEDLPFTIDSIDDHAGEDLKDAMRQFERHHILSVLRRSRYDKTEAAKHLGIGISSLYRKLEDLQIPKNPDEIEAETED